MAAVDLSAIAKFPKNYVKTLVGTTWQAFVLPKGARYVTVKTSAAAYVGDVDTANGGTPSVADGGDAWPIGVLAGERFDLGSYHGTPTICVASVTGTVTAYLCLEAE